MNRKQIETLYGKNFKFLPTYFDGAVLGINHDKTSIIYSSAKLLNICVDQCKNIDDAFTAFENLTDGFGDTNKPTLCNDGYLGDY